MVINIWGQNKPTIRSYGKDGQYKQYKTAHYAGHAVVSTMEEAVKIMQGYFNRGWEVEIKIEA